jgi:hypothetical protein
MPAAARATRLAQSATMSDTERAEFEACSPRRGLAGFLRFCRNHLRIKDKRSGKAIPFELWPCQESLAGDLLMNLWLICLKARQMGMTWLVAAYALWRLTYHPFYTVVVIAQGVQYAEDFVAEKVRFMYDNLPDYMKIPIVRETRTRIVFGVRHRSEIRAFASGKKAGRSLTANLFIADEAAFIDAIEDATRAAEPTLEEAGGQSVIISTADGPKGFFFEQADKAMKGETIDEDSSQAYQFRFWSVFAHPGRDEAWYERMARKNAHRAMYMHYEYPRTPDEAFASSGGRVYPYFGKRFVPDGHVLDIDAETLKRRPDWQRYRCIDWGTTKSAFVCLWVAHIPGKRPRLTVHPDCTQLIREMLAYCYKESTTEPDKKNDHGPDALRYGVVTFNLSGHVHVYRELYIHDIVSQGYTSQSIIALIKERSGWRLSDRLRNIWQPTEDVESYAGTVYDRSNAVLGNEFWQMKEQSVPHTTPMLDAGGGKSEVANGIALVNKLVVGGMPNRSSVFVSEEERRMRLLAQKDPLGALGLRASIPIRDMILKNELKRRRKARRRAKNWAGLN